MPAMTNQHPIFKKFSLSTTWRVSLVTERTTGKRTEFRGEDHSARAYAFMAAEVEQATGMFNKGDRVEGVTPLGREVRGEIKLIDGKTLWIDAEGGDPLAWAPVGRDSARVAS